MLEVTVLKCGIIVKVQDKYWKTDCGHQKEMIQIRIDQESKIKIAGMIIDLKI